MIYDLATATWRCRRPIRSSIVAVLATTALVTAAACAGGDSSTGPAKKNPVGTYGLFQIEQKKIPTEIFRGRFTAPQTGQTFDPLIVTITGGEIILQNDGAIHVAIDYKFAADGQELTGTNKADGSCRIQANDIVISTPNGPGMTGSYRNGVVTLTLDAVGICETRTYTFRYVP